MGIHETFIKWTKMLFKNARALVGLSGSIGKEFQIERGIRQGCPLAPYLFLIVGEVLNHAFKKTVAEGRVIGVMLPSNRMQCIFQYVDDSSLFVKGEK